MQKDGQADAVPTLRAAELEIEQIKQYLGQGLMSTYSAVRSQQAAEQMKRCACGEALPVHRWSHWKHGTLPVDLMMADPYGYCRTCHQSQRPLHGLLGMEPERWSLEVQRAAVDFGTDHSFGKSEQKMQEHYPNAAIGPSSIRTLVLEHGAAAFTYIQEKLAGAAAHGLEKPWSRVGVAHLEVEYDGSYVRIGGLEPIAWGDKTPELTPVRQHEKRRRQTEWKQVNLGAVHERDAVTSLYCGRFGETEAAFDDLFGLGCLAGWALNTQTAGIADGAPPIRPHMQARFQVARPAQVQVTGPAVSDFKFILDRPHTRRHLVVAGEILAAAAPPLATWVDQPLQQIDQGGVMQVIAYLECEAQRTENAIVQGQADYLRRNQDAVDYDRLKTQGYSISSGIVESAHRHVIQQRMKQPGMGWHPDNVDPIVALRLLRANPWWEEYWHSQGAAYQKKADQLRQQHRATLAA